MGLMDLAGSLLGGASGGRNDMAGLVMALLEQQGGLEGLLGRMREGGLGDLASSWVGTGQNLPLNVEQLQSLLGNDTLQNLAAQAGLGRQEAAGGLAELLPQVVDRLTPQGQVPEGEPDLLGTLKGLLG